MSPAGSESCSKRIFACTPDALLRQARQGTSAWPPTFVQGGIDARARHNWAGVEWGVRVVQRAVVGVWDTLHTVKPVRQPKFASASDLISRLH